VKKIGPTLLILLSFLVACGAPSAPPSPTATPPPAGPVTEEEGKLFATSETCTACHTNMVDDAGQDVSTDAMWAGSMMANSARDPYWQASVRGEALANPDYQAVIEDKCATCHMPMARFTAAAGGGQGQVLDDGFAAAGHPLHSLALDGVSCNLCHQIREEGLGTAESFSGGYTIDTHRRAGEREAFGPYPVPPGLVQVMQGSSGFMPMESPHIDRSELCATCHTLYTPYLDAAGEIAGEFPEQMPFQEWLASGYRDVASCQDCHMPLAQGGVQLSITGGPRRQPFFQHVFVGGNAYMLEIFKAFGPELEATAGEAHFQAKQDRAVAQIEGRTGAISIEDVSREGSTLVAEVVVVNRTGHKLPTGFPARRVWIHLTVQDAAGAVVFESGAARADGSIAGNDNDTDPAAYEPHYLAIEDAGQVQIYEAIMGDTEGGVTTTLLKGAGYLKDNRLLPMGFDKAGAPAEVAVYGGATGDADFDGSGDRVQYRIDLGEAQGPFTVTAELLYQPIGYRWADNLRRYDAPEPVRFVGYYEQVSNQPLVVASDRAEVAE
jgi:hypothetical protein